MLNNFKVLVKLKEEQYAKSGMGHKVLVPRKMV